jgi:hypothetical protein
MAGPSKRLGKGNQRLKFKDVSPRAEAGDQEHIKKTKKPKRRPLTSSPRPKLRPELEEVDLTPMAEAADQELWRFYQACSNEIRWQMQRYG